MDVDTVCRVQINSEECTGCGICLASCKKQALAIGSTINRFGVYPVQHSKASCNSCATCYYLCPEPGAIMMVQ